MLDDFDILVADFVPAKSVMPPGGKPADDEAYRAWKDAWLSEQNARAIDQHIALTGELPDREPIDPATFDERLWQALGNTRLIEPPNYHHRLRALALAMRDDRSRFLRAAHNLAARCRTRLQETAV